MGTETIDINPVDINKSKPRQWGEDGQMEREREREAAEKELAKEPETLQPQKKSVQQKFPFIPIQGEVARTYIFGGNEKLTISNVAALSICPDGSHRLLVNSNGGQVAYRIANNFLAIEYIGREGPYVFSE